MLVLRHSHKSKGDILKVYHLIIAYNDKTEEIEYIQEEIEDDSHENGIFMPTTVYDIKVDDDYWDDEEELIKLLTTTGMGEA